MAYYGDIMEKTFARKVMGFSPDVLGVITTTNNTTVIQDTVGKIGFFASTTAPTGWLKCNGATVSRSAYADLFASIGTIFGEGDGSTTFSLPDLRGEFIRGWDNARGIDITRLFGSLQTDEIKSHKHGIRAEFGTSYVNIAPPGQYNELTINTSKEFRDNYCANNGGNETRPRNVSLLACIKY